SPALEESEMISTPSPETNKVWLGVMESAQYVAKQLTKPPFDVKDAAVAVLFTRVTYDLKAVGGYTEIFWVRDDFRHKISIR
ncbi:hypothetical protein A2U01_0042540, partial [Trifolium medium]|nr:hypothetical protein [Trifolium medium]